MTLALCLVLPMVAVPAFAEEGAECICETPCTAESMNNACPVCGGEGADLESCAAKPAPVDISEPGITTEQKLMEAMAGTVPTIVLDGDIDLTSALIIDRTVTLDLNGYTLENTGDGNLAEIKSSGSLTITDSSTDETGTILCGSSHPGGILVDSGGALTLNGGTIEGTGEVPVYIAGSFTITGGTISVDVTVTQPGSIMYADGGTINGNVTLGNYDGVKMTRHETAGYTTFNGGVVAEGEATVEDAVKLTVTFYSNGTQFAEKKVFKGQPVDKPENPTKDDHYFSGWYTAEGIHFDVSGKVKDTMALYADWDCSKGHIYTRQDKTVDPVEGSAGDCQTEAEYYYVCAYCSASEQDSNHTFKGDKNSAVHTGTTKIWVQTETTHQQKWGCCGTLEGKPEGHNWEKGVCKTCDYLCLHIGDTGRSGKTRQHTESQHERLCDECGLVLEHESHEFENGHCECGAVQFSITFDANGGEVSPASAFTNTAGKVDSLPDASWKGYVFNGWFTEKTGGSKITSDQIYAEDTTIYAQWDKIIDQLAFTYQGHAYNRRMDAITVDQENAGINFYGTDNYGGDYRITKNPSQSHCVAGELFKADTKYYLQLSFRIQEGYVVTELSRENITLDGRPALRMTLDQNDPTEKENGQVVTAVFALPTIYTIETSTGKNGTIDPKGIVAVFEGEDVQIKITPDSGYVVYRLTVDGENVKTARTYSFENVQENHTIKARFMKNGSNAKTGDGFPLGPALGAVILSAAGLTGAALISKKKKNR